MKRNEIILRGEDIGVVIGRTMGRAGFYKASGTWVPCQDMSAMEVENGIGNSPQISIPYEHIDNVEVSGNTVWRNRDCYDIGELGKSISQDYYGRGDVVLTFHEGIEELLTHQQVQRVGFRKVNR